MAYRNFDWLKIERDFGILPKYQALFGPVDSVKPSERLVEELADTSDMALTTEKLLSEALVFPILQEIRLKNRDYVRLFSGETLKADIKRGLNGECDFILTKSPQIALTSPIISLTEAKNGEVSDLDSLAQTTAQMIGARVFNQKNNSHEIIHGACTSGREWLFLRLEKNHALIDTRRYSLQNLPELLGVLQYIIDFYE
ncbi:MAG: hypothetical protein MUE30_12950 [Spirosomaceae bacterium]|nr:hypothetical protein [Spirosomataceae bacterium]